MLELIFVLGAVVAAPPEIVVQGRVTNAAGQAVDGGYNLYVSFYAQPDGGDALATVLLADEPVESGTFDAALTGLPDTLFDSDALWIGVAVATEPELARQKVASVPWARSASVASDLACSGCVGAATLDPALPIAWLNAANIFAELATFEKGADLAWSELRRPRIHNAAEAPEACAAGLSGAIYFDTTDSALKVCTGAEWVAVGAAPDPEPTPALGSCAAILAAGDSTGDGVYNITTPTGEVAVWCDMGGGGWTYAAVLNTDTAPGDHTMVPTKVAFGTAAEAQLPDNEYSIDAGGITVTAVRIINFTTGETFTENLDVPTAWPAETYLGGFGVPGMRLPVNAEWELRTGFYVNYGKVIPICFTKPSISTAWICDSDGTAIRGMLDTGAGEFCGLGGADKKWGKADGSCTNYGDAYAAYGIAFR